MMVAQEGLHPPADIVSVELYKVSPSDCATHDLCEGSFCFTIWGEEMKVLATVGKVNLCQASDYNALYIPSISLFLC